MNENGACFRVLVVEDNPHVTELFSYAMRRLSQELLGDVVDVELHEAKDGHEAWKRLEDATAADEPYDVVVLDLMLPVLDGFEVLSRIRATPALASLPVLVITAADGDACLKALDRGATDVLRKPVQIGQIRAALKKIVE